MMNKLPALSSTVSSPHGIFDGQSSQTPQICRWEQRQRSRAGKRRTCRLRCSSIVGHCA